MSPFPLRELSGPQLATLREVLAVATGTRPDLAYGETLTLGALIEAETLRRRPLGAPSQSEIDPPPSVAPAHLAGELAAAIAAVRPEVTSTTKWAEVAASLSRALGIAADAVYVTSVGGLSRNITVRLAQSRRAREAAVAVVIWTASAEPLHLAVSATKRACLDIPRLSLVFSVEAAHAHLAAVVTPPTLIAPVALTLAYPTAQVLPAEDPAPQAHA